MDIFFKFRSAVDPMCVHFSCWIHYGSIMLLSCSIKFISAFPRNLEKHLKVRFSFILPNFDWNPFFYKQWFHILKFTSLKIKKNKKNCSKNEFSKKKVWKEKSETKKNQRNFTQYFLPGAFHWENSASGTHRRQCGNTPVRNALMETHRGNFFPEWLLENSQIP
jgi:hypothetical protein